MKFTCQRSHLNEALKVVGRAVSERSTLPILSNVLITPGDNEVTLAACDLELGICVRLPATVEDPEPLSLPAKTLSEFISGLPDGELTVEVDERNSGLIRMKRTQFRVLGLPAEDYPPMPEVGEGTSFTISEGDLARLIRCVAFAASEDITRPILTGVLLEYQGMVVTNAVSVPVLKLVATDTHRLSARSCRATEGTQEDATCLVPSRALEELLKSLHADGEGSVAVWFDKNQIQFQTPTIALVSRLIEGMFPKYERVIPKSHTGTFSCPAAELLPVVKRSAIVAQANSNKVYISMTPGESGATVAAKAGDVGEIEDEVAVVWTGDETPRRFCLNYRFLVDVLSLKEATIARFEVNSDVEPLVFRPDTEGNWLVLIMPMQKDT